MEVNAARIRGRLKRGFTLEDSQPEARFSDMFLLQSLAGTMSTRLPCIVKILIYVHCNMTKLLTLASYYFQCLINLLNDLIFFFSDLVTSVCKYLNSCKFSNAVIIALGVKTMLDFRSVFNKFLIFDEALGESEVFSFPKRL